ncbi:hypothetical protein TURU_071801 [Turdus rufiventris]|nr:hypothetical protein TURU_071801 [Turdus rufiventris]
METPAHNCLEKEIPDDVILGIPRNTLRNPPEPGSENTGASKTSQTQKTSYDSTAIGSLYQKLKVDQFQEIAAQENTQDIQENNAKHLNVTKEPETAPVLWEPRIFPWLPWKLGRGLRSLGKVPKVPAVVRTMVKQAVLLQLMEDHGDADIHLQPVEEHHAGASGCLEEAVILWDTCGARDPAPRLDPPVLGGLHPMEVTHAAAV